jgi:hypothetical protein
MQESLDHAVEVIVAVGQLLAGDRASDRITEQEDAQLGAVPFAQSGGEAEGVVRAFAAVRLVVHDDQDVH